MLQVQAKSEQAHAAQGNQREQAAGKTFDESESLGG